MVAAGLSRYSFPLWPTARARIVIASSFASSHFYPLFFCPPSSPSAASGFTSIGPAPRRWHFLSFCRRHRRSAHDPSISHFPEKINCAHFRIYIYIEDSKRDVSDDFLFAASSAAAGTSGPFSHGEEIPIYERKLHSLLYFISWWEQDN